MSADSIAPKPENPQTRNRYSYTLNNPIRYTDPSGHCSESSLDEADRSENRKCDEYKEQLSNYGISLDNLFDWISSDLGLIIQAVSDLRNAAGWSFSDFRAAMGGGVNLLRASTSFLGYAAVQNNGQITFYDSAFASPAGTADSLRIIVHEFAHRWDEASGSKLTHNMVSATGGRHRRCIDAFGWCDVYVRGDIGATPRDFDQKYYDDPYEDFAESVAITVYPNAPGANLKFVNGKRYNYIQEQFKDYRALETS